MEIEVGKRYRLARTNGLPDVEGVVTSVLGVQLFQVGEGLATLHFGIDREGVCAGHGYLVEIETAPTAIVVPPPMKLRPIFGHDPGEFARMQRMFREGRDLTLGVG